MTHFLFYAFFVSLLIGTALTPFVIVGAKKIGLLDQPGYRKVHKEPIARAGGIAFAVGALVSITVWAPHNPLIVGTTIGACIILLVGSLDDFFDLSVRHKFLGQILAAATAILYSQVSWQPFSSFLELNLPPWGAVLLMLFLVVVVTNAINFSDGLDGLAGGMTFLSFGIVAFLAYEINDIMVLYLTLPIMGGLLGFLRFNTFPARVFMGDGGSQLLGFLLGMTALFLTTSDRSPFSPFLVFFFFGVPLLDMLAVTSERLLSGQSPLKADQKHLHHKILSLGFSHHQAVLILYTLQVVMVVLAYALRWESDVVLASVYGICLTVTGTLFYVVSTHRLEPDLFRASSSGIFHWRTWIHARPWLSTRCLQILGVLVVGLLILSVALPLSVPPEIAYSAFGVVGLLIIGLLGSSKDAALVARMGLYLGCTFVLYLLQQYLASQGPMIQTLFHGYFGFLVMLLLLSIHLDNEARFQTNPMDYLLLFVALAIPFLPTIELNNINLGALIARLIILFFACEVLLQAYATRVRYLGYLSILVLSMIGVHAWL